MVRTFPENNETKILTQMGAINTKIENIDENQKEILKLQKQLSRSHKLSIIIGIICTICGAIIGHFF